MLLLARQHCLPPQLLLLALAFAVTTGSVMSPIGNPQNLLIALDPTMDAPFVDFFAYLFIPTVINLFVAFLILRVFFRSEFGRPLVHPRIKKLKDPRLASLSRLSLALILLMILLKVFMVTLDTGLDIRLTYIAVAGALPLLLFSGRRGDIIRKMDWRTLVFFASMFVLLRAVWDTGFFQELIDRSDLPVSQAVIMHGMVKHLLKGWKTE